MQWVYFITLNTIIITGNVKFDVQEVSFKLLKYKMF